MNFLSKLFKTSVILTTTFLVFQIAHSKPRARDLGISFEGIPGELNSITDVAGVEVGYSTVIQGEGKLVVGKGPVRTGVTAVFPRGKSSNESVFAGSFVLNGNGEMTGLAWVNESGYLEGPVMITNTHSVGSVHEAVIKWQVSQDRYEGTWSLPVVGETWDGFLNDINGFHVGYPQVANALESAKSGPIAEGNVGGGTGMVCYEFKGGTGTASRIMKTGAGTFVVGVLVQANFGRRHQLSIAGIPIGKTLTENAPYTDGRDLYKETGSMIAVVATDAPLLPIQLKRLATRVSLGMARTGATSGNGSGDIFIAFSTANADAADSEKGVDKVAVLSNEHISGLFSAVALATEEAIINALVAAETMTGRDNHNVIALPHDQMRALLKRHHRQSD
ncbi:MAG: P1 family peptidase [Verrucomicrobia bacterium]|nr:P1 family peptidase [Verrucomicrobiota bacterium]